MPLIDVRIPNKAIAKLRNHHATVNGIAWSPYTPYHVCTAGKFFKKVHHVLFYFSTLYYIIVFIAFPYFINNIPLAEIFQRIRLSL